MAAIKQRRMTLEEFLALEEQEPELEFMNGVVTQKPLPKARHSILQSLLAHRFTVLGLPSKTAFAFTELRTTFGGASTVPDVAVFRWERILRDAAGEPLDDVLVPPDLAVEIISLGQTVAGAIRKCQWYVANGVGTAVFVNWRDRSVHLFRAGEPAVQLRGEDLVDLSEIVPGFRMTAAEIFDLLVL